MGEGETSCGGCGRGRRLGARTRGSESVGRERWAWDVEVLLEDSRRREGARGRENKEEEDNEGAAEGVVRDSEGRGGNNDEGARGRDRDGAAGKGRGAEGSGRVGREAVVRGERGMGLWEWGEGAEEEVGFGTEDWVR